MKTFCNICKHNLKLAAMTAVCILFFSNTGLAAASPSEEQGPGVIKTVEPAPAQSIHGESLGIFSTTGYCNCDRCSGGSGLTYSGTAPKANHTISADISVLPIGTKVRINDIVYTVEDIGSSVAGQKVDIYYGSHDEAWAHGLEKAEVFVVEWPQGKAPAEEAPTDEPKESAVLQGPGDTQ